MSLWLIGGALLLQGIAVSSRGLTEICSIDLDLGKWRKSTASMSLSGADYEKEHDMVLDVVYQDVWGTVNAGAVSAEVALSDTDVKRFRALDKERPPDGFRSNFGKDYRADGPDKCISSTLAHYSAMTIFEHLVAATPGDTFVDIGSGVGRVLVSAVLFNNAGKAVGIEFSHARAELACQAIRRLKRLLAKPGQLPCGSFCREQLEKQVGNQRHITVYAGDAREFDFQNASRIFAYANCMPASVLIVLRNHVLQEAPVGAQVWVTNPHGFSTGSNEMMAGRTFDVVAPPFRLVVSANKRREL